ncbi:MAG: cobalamin biosynthesis protein [Lachnospiraceae bacterium]|nr:cobalamin biosynthesis protein [Lachnospiraceae bacterium]
MIKTAISFNEKGRKVTEKLNRAFDASGIDPADVYDLSDKNSGVSLPDLVRSEFSAGHPLIFVGAVGIAVRAVSGCIKDKLNDAPVVVIDDNGGFVIPILSGHAGGANKLAVMIAELLGAIPVITTSTDINDAFSADVFASENRLTVGNREGIKRVAVKALEGKPVTLSIKDYPPTGEVDIIIADETDRECSLLLSPKPYVLGIGARKGIDPGALERHIMSTIEPRGIDIKEVYALATLDIKENERAIKEFSVKYRIPIISFEASVLKRAKGEFSGSDFVEKTVGVDNVCERAAVLAAGPGAELICPKQSGEGITVAISLRKTTRLR